MTSDNEILAAGQCSGLPSKRLNDAKKYLKQYLRTLLKPWEVA